MTIRKTFTIFKSGHNSKLAGRPSIELNHKSSQTNTSRTGSKLIISYELDPTYFDFGDQNSTLRHFESYLCDLAMLYKVDIMSHIKYDDVCSHHKFKPTTIQEYGNKYWKNAKSSYWRSEDI